ncbi:17966_t:CDS:2, partial [Gigaspora margarita]
YSLLSKITPHVLSLLQHDLTGDISALENSQSKELDERLRLMLEIGDPDILVDLRINNGFKGTKFNIFWNELKLYFKENSLAVQDRRHGSILYMPSFISARNLKDQIITRIKNKLSNITDFDNIAIPSERWISYQFLPKNPWAKASTEYVGQFDIKYKVQAHLLQKSHPDSHYCRAIFKYLRHFSVKFKNNLGLIFADDKHKIPIGEDTPTSTGVCNRYSAISANATLVANDHDFTK